MFRDGKVLGVHWHGWLAMLFFAPTSIAVSFLLAPGPEPDPAVTAATTKPAAAGVRPESDHTALPPRPAVSKNGRAEDGKPGEPAKIVARVQRQADNIDDSSSAGENPYLPVAGDAVAPVDSRVGRPGVNPSRNERGRSQSAERVATRARNSAPETESKDAVSATGRGTTLVSAGGGGGFVSIGGPSDSTFATESGDGAQAGSSPRTNGTAQGAGNPDNPVTGASVGSADGETGANPAGGTGSDDAVEGKDDGTDDGLFETISGLPPPPPAPSG